MRVYEIFIPEIGTYVKFKAMSPEDIQRFVSELEFTTKEEYVKYVLEYLVFNMKTEILDSLKMMSRNAAHQAWDALFNGCVMLNPGIDIDQWVKLTYLGLYINTANVSSTLVPVPAGDNQTKNEKDFVPKIKKAPKKITKSKFLNLEKYLKDRVIGQDEAIESVTAALRRSQAGLSDPNRPLGVFLFSGSSGVGKTSVANHLHEYLFGDQYDIVRIDCGELQHKHENQRLLGSANGYVGFEEGGRLTNQVAKFPNTVVLLDEVEKAHTDIWDTFLRIFDDGMITNNKGEQVSFRNAIIIMTTNLGNDKTVEALTGKGIGFGARNEMVRRTIDIPTRSQVERHTFEAIKKTFKPEFLNRIDQVIVFNHLSQDDFTKIAELEMQLVEDKLSKKGITLKYDDQVTNALVELGADTVSGARGMSQVRRGKIENLLAETILGDRYPRGTIFEMNYEDDQFKINTIKPKKALGA